MSTENGKPNKLTPEKSEEAMIEGIVEGSPDAIAVAVVRLDCGCRKMAAIDKDGEPASKVIMYRDRAESICEKCQEDDGAFSRTHIQFIHWEEPEPDAATKSMITEKVLGIKTQ
jgi:sugar (pentulose or hexulose) kinase